MSYLSRLKNATSVLTTAGFMGAALICAPGASSQAAEDNTYQFEEFENIDVDRSGFLENDEYLDVAFGMADWDNDGYLEDTEWVKYTEVFYDPYELEYDAYNYYDTDGDGFIDRSEFNEVPTAELMDNMDVSGDAAIDASEWDKVKATYYDPE